MKESNTEDMTTGIVTVEECGGYMGGRCVQDINAEGMVVGNACSRGVHRV